MYIDTTRLAAGWMDITGSTLRNVSLSWQPTAGERLLIFCFVLFRLFFFLHKKRVGGGVGIWFTGWWFSSVYGALEPLCHNPAERGGSAGGRYFLMQTTLFCHFSLSPLSPLALSVSTLCDCAYCCLIDINSRSSVVAAADVGWRQIKRNY
jgi:hypothetical protein